MLFHKTFSSVFGIGYLKGGGTFAAIAACSGWYFLFTPGLSPAIWPSVIITLAVIFAGVWSSTIVEKIWGKDPSRVVIDEVAGMLVSLLFIPVKLKYLIAALILFRFFDIVKPVFIRKMEKLPSGWGIMMDDVLSGIYTNLLLSAVVSFNLF
ncbi:MAG TPA: phosphatidylglycerophosphatase A [Mucilaginibacter sp.]|nr:phosphatidylglycerophosphatase A [Mucilaginibacter sp.]